MQLSIEHEESVTIVTVIEKRLDASIAPEFKQQMEEIIQKGSQQGKKQIILDISAIQFMDSSSLGAMVVVLKAMGNQGKLIISGATGVVLELFKLTRMDRVFNLSADINEAKRSLM